MLCVSQQNATAATDNLVKPKETRHVFFTNSQLLVKNSLFFSVAHFREVNGSLPLISSAPKDTGDCLFEENLIILPQKNRRDNFQSISTTLGWAHRMMQRAEGNDHSRCMAT